jgi:hypothetical protein
VLDKYRDEGRRQAEKEMLGLLTDVKVDAEEITRPLKGAESTLSS